MGACSVWAQVSSPLLGWLPEGSEIRPIHGLPAAALLGSPVSTGHKLRNTTVSPAQNYALATDAQTGQVLLILPGRSVTALNVPSAPDLIATSPRGTSAILWYSNASALTVVSNLPSAPAIRQIDSTAPVSAIAVSDDGQTVAAASAMGVLEWGADGSSGQVYPGADAAAIAFFPGRSDLAIATSTQLLAITGSSTNVLLQGSYSPLGVAVSFDNSTVILADRNGTIYSANIAAGTSSTFDCQCRPGGIFGLGGDLFRLTTSASGPVKLFDASAGAVYSVPRAGVETRRLVRTAQDSGTLPTLTINLSPVPTGFLQQPSVTITSSAAYASEIDGNLTLTYTSSVGGTDGTILFSNGSTTVNFTIPAGSTQANFSGAKSVTFSTGTVAGTISLAANITAPTMVSSVATQSVTTQPGVAVITRVTLSQTTGGVTVVITGYSSPWEVTSATFNFALVSGATINNDLTVSVSQQFQAYFSTSPPPATGSEFTLSVPFAITGNAQDITGVSVTILNNKGISNPVSSK
jgi:hypothetical protein